MPSVEISDPEGALTRISAVNPEPLTVYADGAPAVPSTVVASDSDPGLTATVGVGVGVGVGDPTAPIQSWSPVNPGLALVWKNDLGLPLPGDPPCGVTN